MSEDFMAKRNGGLFPITDHAIESLERVKEGDIVLVNYRKPRNIGFHRKFFALLRVIYDAIDWEGRKISRPPFEAFRRWILVKVGHYDVAVMPDGTRMEVPRSISFSSMDEIEFEELYEAVVSAGLDLAEALSSREDVDKAVNIIAGF